MTQVTGSDGRNWAGYASAILTGYNQAFALTKFTFLDSAGDPTMTHEFGHLYGCRHDVFVDPSTSPFPHGHGHVNLSEGWRTIMAYKTFCTATSCPRIPHFSNPVVSWNGVPTGIAGTSDNEAVLDATYTAMANFEDTPLDKTVWASDVVGEGDIATIRGENTLTTSTTAPYEVSLGGVATFIAGDKVVLKPGFKAKAGCSFKAMLRDCTTVE